MSTRTLPFRQIHLDFHTSPAIPEIGWKFDKVHWQGTLREARVNSVTLFSKCHHGWSYHPTTVGQVHPHLNFDLLRTQFDACKEIGIAAPIYVSAGVDNVASHEHPDWRCVGPDGKYAGWCTSPIAPGFHTMDFHSPYLDYLCAQIREVVTLFPNCDGIFLDIISQYGGCGQWSMDYMAAHGLDAMNPEHREQAMQAALERYYRLTTEAARSGSNTDMPVFHNSGHIPRGRRDILPYFSHLELESLPTGGWGYDHFPMSAKYVANLGMEFLGMTGKFHTTWGEFGGYKHPNALRYECAAMIAYGAKCSIGDQLHPGGRLDDTTYKIIGSAYREVEAKEPWCVGARPVSDVAVLSSESEHKGARENAPDEGATRALLEEHALFTLVDRAMDFAPYKLLVLPDDISIDAALKDKLDTYLTQGGKLLLTGESGLWQDGSGFAFDIGAEFSGASPFSPDFVKPAESIRPGFVEGPMVMYVRSQRIRATEGESLGEIYDPYFNRRFDHFCSHQHTPYKPEPSGFDVGVLHGNILYFAHPIFTLYRMYGAVAYRHYFGRALKRLLGSQATIAECPLPSTARVALNVQPAHNRHILHLLFANTVARGGSMELSGGTVSTRGLNVEIIEEILPLHNIQIRLRNLPPLRAATLEPAGHEIPFTQHDGITAFTIPELSCHQMLALHHA